MKNAEVFAQNPLGKVPVLLRDEGSALLDSDVICADKPIRSNVVINAGGEQARLDSVSPFDEAHSIAPISF